jgi:peptidyl-prolyl cis-trans isomerase A (cyclophilin A)
MLPRKQARSSERIPRSPRAGALPLIMGLLLAAGLSLLVASGVGAQEAAGAKASEGQKAKPQAPAPDPLKKPALAREKAPENFRVEFDTTKGKVILEVTRAWSPHGADRFYNLVKIGFFQDIAFFRVIENFMVQFGIHGDPAISRVWKSATIKDDPVVQSNTRGMLSFAKTGRPNSRTTQIFINFSDNLNLDGMGFSPFARVTDGMDVVDKIYKVGEGGPRGPGPNQQKIQSGGNRFLKAKFPELDYIRGAKLLD